MMLTRQLGRSIHVGRGVTRVIRPYAPVFYGRHFANPATPKPLLDYYDEIMVDHNNVRDLHERFKIAHQKKDERLMDTIANTIVYEASLHADGEELSVYRALDKHGLRPTAEHDREAHKSLKAAMAFVDTNSTKSVGRDEFADAVENACQLFLQHAEEEEKDQYPRLSEKLTPIQKAELARDYLEARASAPTRPHPRAPQRGGIVQKVTKSMLRVADAPISGIRDYVDLKYTHRPLN